MIGLDAQIALLTRLGSAPLGPLVDALRELHVRGPAAANELRELLSAVHAPPPETPTRDRPQRTVPAVHDADYEAARRHFADHGRRLREQALLAERLLDAFVRRQSNAPPASLRHELSLTCARGETASTQFVVVNRETRAMNVRFDVRVPEADVTAAPDLSASLSFDPPAPCLQPNDEIVVRCSLDTRRWPAPAGSATLDVDVRSDDRLLTALWLRLHVTEPEAADGQPPA